MLTIYLYINIQVNKIIDILIHLLAINYFKAKVIHSKRSYICAYIMMLFFLYLTLILYESKKQI